MKSKRGWLEGPFEVDSALDKFGKRMVPARRFLVCQKGKFRPIDDYSVCGANSTVGTEEQPFLQTWDALVSQIRFVQRRLVNTGGVEKTSVKGRSIDLDNAVRQLATNPEVAHSCCIAVYSPSLRRPVIFLQLAMPFGSRTSVQAFARVSEFVRCVIVRILKILCTVYVDDFGIVDRADTCGSCSFAAEECLKALGIRFSMKA
eukprot:5615702-Amphidinium_carterae.1